MKTKLLSTLLGLLVSVFSFGQTAVDLPVNFDDSNVAYNLVDFGGNTSSIVTDPTGGTNQVVQIDKSNTAALWAGTTIGGTAGFANAISFASGATRISMRVYSPDAGIQVRLKAEDPSNPGISVETEATTTTSNAWETLEFNFANQANGTAAINYSNTYQKLSMFFNFGVDGATAGAKTYYADDIEFMPAVILPITITFQVQNPDSTPVFIFGSWSGWGNWPGTLMTSVGNNTYTADITLTPSTNYEYLFVNGGTTPTKEALNPADPCTNGSTPFTNRVINTGTIDTTICAIWNTCNSCAGVVSSQIDLPVTFDDTNINYSLVDFGGNASTIEPDPAGGLNNVCKVIKSNTAQLWAGTTVGGPAGLANPIPFASNSTKISMRVYSPDAGIQIRMKAEDPTNPTISVETEATTTTSNAWETLEFNFANQANGTAAINFNNVYQMISVFFNFGVDGATAGTKTYYFDDIQMMPAGPSTINVSFQVQNPDSTPVYIFGSWSGWSNWPGDLMSSVGNGTYSATIPLTASTNYEYLFVNGGTVPTKEALNPNDPCTNGNTLFTNRVINTGLNDTTFCAIWNTCNSCNVVITVPVDLPVTFEDTNTVYGLTDFGGNISAIVADPTGASNTVARVEKTNSAQTWAGTTIGGTIGFYNVIPFAAGSTKMRMRVYSPDSGIQIRMKAEDPSNPTISVETEATTTTANAWETLEFDFANQATGTAAINFANIYQKVSVFFNFGIDGATAGTKIYYFDDVEFGGNPPAAVNYTFRVQSPDSLPVFVFGSWSGWGNWPGTLLTSIGNNMYETTIALTANTNYEYLFVDGGTTPTKEVLDPSWPCTNGNTQFTNRILTTGSSDSTFCSIWATCNACSTVGVNELSNTDVKVVMQNNGVRILSSTFNHADQLEIIDVLGRTIYSTTGNVPVNSFIPVNFGSGSVYLIKLKVNGSTAIYKAFAGN